MWSKGESEMSYEYHKLTCSHCNRKILVEIMLDGTSHNMGVQATCADCLGQKGLGTEFKAENPTAASDIEHWLSEVKA